MRKTAILSLAASMFATAVFAKNPGDSTKIMEELMQKKIDSLEATLHYKKGTVQVGNGLATINIPDKFKFLEADEAEYVISDIWGNLKGDKPLGLIVPANEAGVIASYAFIVRFDEVGYVKDKDADKIDYTKLLKDMKEDQVKANQQRSMQGLDQMFLVGWAAQPFYDKERKVLHWAIEAQTPGAEENTLNYNIKVLGRRGVLDLKAVSGMSSLDTVKAHINDVLGIVNFNEGHKYSNFDSNTDKVAAWTIGGLVAGKILAKVGLWAVILKFLKFIILGVVVAGGAIWRFITGRKKKQEEYQYEPQPPTNNSDTPEKTS